MAVGKETARRMWGAARVIVMLMLAAASSGGTVLKADRERYFKAVIFIPKDCTLRTEPGITAFIDSGYRNYPLLLKVGSDTAMLAFYDITGTVIEEIGIEGFKKTQIENVLDNRGFYCEDADLFKEQELSAMDASFLELFADAGI